MNQQEGRRRYSPNNLFQMAGSAKPILYLFDVKYKSISEWVSDIKV